MSDWCILRTKARQTLALAESLCNVQFDAWTPVEKLQLPRKRVKIPVAVMPTWVFAKASDLLVLLELADTPRKPQPEFSVFQFNGRYRTVAESELRSLRLYVEAARPAEERHIFRRGAPVTVDDPAWAGLTGIVERDNGKVGLVVFGKFELEVQSIFIHPTERRQAA